MYLVINKWIIAVKVSNFSGQYLRNHRTLDIGVLGYIGIVWPKEHSPEVRSFPPGTPCIYSNACGMYLWMLPSDGGICTGRRAHFMCSIIVFVIHSEMDVGKTGTASFVTLAVLCDTNAQGCHKVLRWLCPTVFNRCKVGTGIQKSLWVSTGTVRHGTVHVHSRRYIGD